MEKTAVILLNLGGPDSKEAIKPFLFNFFMDPAIISAPKLVRWLLAKRIAQKRSGNEAGKGYSLLGYKSPLLENTEKQARALEKELNERKVAEYKTFVCMRYWHPMTEDVVKQVLAYNPDKIVLLPLYPQFSTTTTGSSFAEWDSVAEEKGLNVKTKRVCCFPFGDGFIKGSAEKIKEVYERSAAEAKEKQVPPPRLLFSAHGLPEKIIKKGDPYQWQCEESAAAIAQATGIKDLDWEICYQSRVGPLKWIGPSTEEALEKAGADNVPVVVYPHAFVSEHIETLVEIDMEYRVLAKKLGIPAFTRVETVGENQLFIRSLADLIDGKSKNERICPALFGACPRNGAIKTEEEKKYG